MKMIPVNINKGIIKLIQDPFQPLKNMLILHIHWHEKDHTDSIYCERSLDIDEKQWLDIINEKLLNKEVEFKMEDAREHTATIIFPTKIYTEEEVKVLVIKAWNVGYEQGLENKTHPCLISPIDFWRTNKK